MGETILYRLRLHPLEEEKPELAVPHLQPLVVMRADLVWRGCGLPRVEVAGWLLGFPDRRSLTRPAQLSRDAPYVQGLGWIEPCPGQPSMTWVAEIEGPDDAPNTWRWRGEPR